jgi:CRP-like cAMP-binding protein
VLESLERNTHRLTNYHLSKVRKHLDKPINERNYEKLLHLTSPLKFFKKFSKFVAMQILSFAEHSIYKSGEAVFHQGDVGDMMYIILSGSISVLKKSAEFGGCWLVVNTLYDGDSFGELSIISTEKNDGKQVGRAASCIAAETTDLLQVPKVKYHEILLNQIKSTIDTRLEFFSSLPFFQGVPLHQLVPLVSNTEPRDYTMGDTILESGDYPEGLYIIKEG